ncbi:MBL fold metallo-hydrolase [Zoogloea sp.]
MIAGAGEAVPGKPIQYLINTHAHFDHLGCLCFFAPGPSIRA